MTVVIRQARANLRGHRLPTWLVLLTLLAAATLLTLVLSTFCTAQGAYDRLFERSHGAHLWLELNPALTSAETVESVLTSLPGVQETTSPRTYLFARLLAGEAPEEVRLGDWPGESVTVGRPLLMVGRVPQPEEADMIALDRNFAMESNLSVGDAIKLLTPTGWQPMTVSGLFVTDRFPPYPSYGPTLAYMASGAREELGLVPPGSLETVELAIGLRLHNPPDPQAARQAAVAALLVGSVVSAYDWLDTRRICESNIPPRRILLLTFSLVARLAAGFLTANAIGGAVRAQTRQIGLLKAVGFTGRQLALVFLSESLGLALLASLGGLLLGGLLASTILGPIALRFGETLVRPPLWVTLVTPLATLLVAALFTLGPVRRAARLDVVRTIRAGSEPLRRRAGRVRWLPISPALGLGEALSHPLRSVLTALGLGVTMVALTFALTAVHTLQAFERDPSLGGMRDGDLLASPSPEVSGAELRRLIADQADVTAFYGELEATFQFPGEEEILQAHFREGDLAAFRFPLIEGRMPAFADEAVVSHVLSWERDLRPGDTMTILLEGKPVTLQVVGLYREGLALGRMLILSTDLRRRFKPTVESTRYLLKVRPEADAQAVLAALKGASGGKLRISEIETPETLTALPGVLAGLSVMLGGLAAVGAFNTAWMGRSGETAGVRVAQGSGHDTAPGGRLRAGRDGGAGVGRLCAGDLGRAAGGAFAL